MGASKSFRKLINKFSSRSSLRGLNNNQSNLVEASSSPAQSHSTAQFLLPKNPAEVSKHRHDHVPKHLPKHTDGCNEVRYFLYTAFTVRTFGLTKTCPQWVLETCWAWKGKGYELLNMDDHALREICPLFPGSAPIDRSLYKVEDFPAPEVRELIGTALLMVMRECKAIMDVRSDHIQQRLVTERKRALSRVVAMPVPNTRRISADSDLRDRVSSYSSLRDPSTAKTSPPPSMPISAGGQRSVNTNTMFPDSVLESGRPTMQIKSRTGTLPRPRMEETISRSAAPMFRSGLEVPEQRSMRSYTSLPSRFRNRLSDLSASQQDQGTVNVRAQPQSLLGRLPLPTAVPGYTNTAISNANSNVPQQVSMSDRQANEWQMNQASRYRVQSSSIDNLPSQVYRQYNLCDLRGRKSESSKLSHKRSPYIVQERHSPQSLAGRQERPPSRAASVPDKNLSCRTYVEKLRPSTSTSIHIHMSPYPYPGTSQHTVTNEDVYMTQRSRQGRRPSLDTSNSPPEALHTRAQTHAQSQGQRVLASAARLRQRQDQVRSPVTIQQNDQADVGEWNRAQAADMHRLAEHRERIKKIIAPGKEVDGVVRGSGGRKTCYQMIEQKSGQDQRSRRGTVGEQYHEKWKR